MQIFFLLFVLFLNAFAQDVLRTKVIMGTFVTVTLPEEKKQDMQAVFKIMKNVDASLSSFKQNSPIFKLNQNKITSLDAYSYEALQLSQKYYNQTDGYFNVAIGAITKDLYCFGKEEKVPQEKALKRSDTSFKNLHFTQTQANISHTIKIDLGGLGKGFAVDKAMVYLKEHQVRKAKVAASGDIRCLGTCKIEIKNPFSEKPLFAFETKKQEMGISTSGNYEHFVKNTQYNHLINPKTKHSQTNFISVTLISALPSSQLDAFATAISVMPKEKAFVFLKKFNIAYVILDTQMKLFISENISQLSNEIVSKKEQEIKLQRE